MILVFWMLSFRPAFSLSSFTFIKRLFSSSSLSAIRVVSSAYLKLLILLPGILIPAWVNNVLLKLLVSNYFMHIANVWYITVRTVLWSECLCSPKTHTEVLTPPPPPPKVMVSGLNHLWMGFPGGSEVKASAHNAGDLGLIPGSGRSPGEGNGNPLQYSCLENPMDRGAWWAAVHGVAKSRTRLSGFTFTFT